MSYRFEHDPESGAIYIRLRAGEIAETVPLADPGFGAAVDVDTEGNVLGVEFLSFEEFAELVERAGGALDLPERMEITARNEAAFSAAALAALSPREREVLELLAEGMTNREIAERLSVSEAAVRRHLNRAIKALGVSNRDEARTRLAARESG
jgi:RNA polymerase sigma factor (sigma-70 family)